MTEVDKAYIAGFFDGEGFCTIRLFHQKNGNEQTQIGVGITQNNREILEWIQSIYGGSISGRQGYDKAHDLCFQKAPVLIPFLTDILPYLKLKTKQAHLALEFCKYLDFTRGRRQKTSPEVQVKRLEMREQMLSLNRKDKRR